MQLVFAQQPVSIHLTEKDGVPDNEFYDIIEDNEGYIWLAADKGLFRFDGVNYNKILHPEQRGLSVFNLNKDGNGTIWYVNISGQVFYIENGKSVLFGDYKNEFQGELPALAVANNLIFLYTDSLLIIANKTTQKKIKTIDLFDDGLAEPFIHNNYLYYGTTQQLLKLDLYTLELKQTLPIIKKYAIYTQRTLIASLENETLVYFTKSKKEGLNFFKFSSNFNNEIQSIAENFPKVNIVNVKNINNQLWYCTEKGVYVCELQGNKLVIKQHLFPNQFITNVVVDKHSNYWFTTLNNALFVVPNLAIKNVDIDLQKEKIRAINSGNENELLINTTNYSFYRYNVFSNKKDVFTFKEKPRIHYSAHNPYTNKYYAYTDLGIRVFNSDFKYEKSISAGGTLKDVNYLSAQKAIAAYRNYANLEEIHYKNNPIKLYQKKARGYAVHYQLETEDSYFATINGLYLVDKNLKEQEIKYNGKSIYVKDIAQTQDGTIWCSSFKNGLYAIKNKEVIKHYTLENGLLSNTNPYIKSKDNSLWIAGENGIQYFNTTTGEFQNLTKREGIRSYNYNGLEIIKDKVFIGSPDQIIYFNEKDVFKPYNTPEVNITSLNIANVKQPLKSEYTIQEKASAIDIHFNAIGYKTSTSGKFEYRLIGLQNNWTESIAGVSNVQYNTLLEGEYTFQIRNVTTNKEEAVTKEIKFIVTKPFWEKLWFYVMLSVLFITFILLLYRRQIKARDAEKNTLLKQLEANNELVNLKLENLRSQMNPHFVFNALNSIQDYILSNKKDLAGDYLGKFADLIRTYLDHSTKGILTLEEEIRTLNMYLELEKLRFEDSLEYTIETTKTINPELISIPTMLIQPYVENALKHGLLHKKTDRKLTVSFSKFSEGIIQCIIEDNGVGREKSKALKRKRSQQHKSFALKATNERLGLLNYGKSKKVGVEIIDLISTTNQPIGTKVILKIPTS